MTSDPKPNDEISAEAYEHWLRAEAALRSVLAADLTRPESRATRRFVEDFLLDMRDRLDLPRVPRTNHPLEARTSETAIARTEEAPDVRP